jgi:16S rRNA (uracil1498-N3)-methyltransferase
MRTVRSFNDTPLIVGHEILLPEQSSNHLMRVLRMQIGDSFHVFNGDGCDYVAEIIGVEKKGVKVRILSRIEVSNESPLKIHLYQSIARGDKMDWILQKAAELGVTAFTPIVSDRTEVKLDGERSDKKLNHWQGVVRSACEQSGRAFIPQINLPIAINQLNISINSAQAFYLEPTATLCIKEICIQTEQELHLAIGPEGGFSERDTRILQTAGFQGLKIGPRILRTETAGLAVIAALQAQFGDWT